MVPINPPKPAMSIALIILPKLNDKTNVTKWEQW
jgi:hypothetical protein